MRQISERDLGIRIGVAVRRYRELEGWTQATLAKRAEVAQAEISHIERGKRSKLSTLDRVSIALGRRLSDLIRFAEDIGDVEEVKRKARAFVRETRAKLREQEALAKQASGKPSSRRARYASGG